MKSDVVFFYFLSSSQRGFETRALLLGSENGPDLDLLGMCSICFCPFFFVERGLVHGVSQRFVTDRLIIGPRLGYHRF